MNKLSLDVVLTELVAELTEQRRRNASYLALARAILVDDPSENEEREASAA